MTGSIVCQAGDTVQTKCTFRDFTDVKVNPEVVKIIIYDAKQQNTSEVILGDSAKLEDGVYFYNYKTGIQPQITYLEWHGEINGFPSIKRISVKTKFIT